MYILTFVCNDSLVFQREKSSTPGMKPGTPMSQESNTPGPSGPPQFRPVPGKPGVDLGKNVPCACFFPSKNTQSVPLLLKGIFKSLIIVWRRPEKVSFLFSGTQSSTVLQLKTFESAFPDTHFQAGLALLYVAILTSLGRSSWYGCQPASHHHLDLISRCGQNYSAPLTL